MVGHCYWLLVTRTYLLIIAFRKLVFFRGIANSNGDAIRAHYLDDLGITSCDLEVDHQLGKGRIFRPIHMWTPKQAVVVL